MFPVPLDGASKVFKTFKDKIMRLYNRVTGKQTQRNKIGELKGPHELEPEPFNPREREQAFKKAYRS